MLKRLIRGIRRKPKAVRDQIAFWIAISFTSLVILGWVLTIPERYGGEANERIIDTDAESVTQDPSSFSDMMDEVRNEIDTFQQVGDTPAVAASSTPAQLTTTAASSTPVLDSEIVSPVVRIATFTAPIATTTP